MQALDLQCNRSIDPPIDDPSTMLENCTPIHSHNDHSLANPDNSRTHVESDAKNENCKEDSVRNSSVGKDNDSTSVVVRRERPSRACTQRAAARMHAAAEAEAERKRKKAKGREMLTAKLLKEKSEEDGVNEDESGKEDGSQLQVSKIVAPLVGELEPSQLPRWNIQSMWQLASILNFLNLFRHLLNIKVEFSAEEFETALLTPNNTLGDVHMPLLKAIPPVTRMALGHGTWVTVLCRKLRDWWHWVAEGDLPIVAAHGAEVEAYNALDPGVRVVILKALCDIRVEQGDIRNYIDDSIKQGLHLSAFRKERIGGDSHGISYWYENDPIIGHRLYREIRKVEVKKRKGKNAPQIPHSSYQWEAVATNLDEFLNVSEKLFASKNRTEMSVGKKLKNDMLPEIEKVHKRKERQLKKQHRQALMLDSMMSMNSLTAGRYLRDRKPVTYTFDDYDRSINEALKASKNKQRSPEPFERRDPHVKLEVSMNGRLCGPSQYSSHNSFTRVSSESLENDEFHDDRKTEALDRSNRRRQRPHRYSAADFVEVSSDNEADFDSDDDIVGEVVYDDNYLSRKKRRRKSSSSSEGNDKYLLDENPEEEDEEEEEKEDDDGLSTSGDSGWPCRRRHKPVPSRTRRDNTRLRLVDELQSGLRRSKRATRNRIDYRQIEMSESDKESMKPEKSNAIDEHYDASDFELSVGSQDLDGNADKQEMDANQPREENCEVVDEKQASPQELQNSGDQESDGFEKRRFLDLNELAPSSGFEEDPTSTRDEDKDEQ